MEILRTRTKQASFPFLGANLVDAATRAHPDFVKPWTIVERSGVKVGVIGLCFVDTPKTTQAKYVTGLEFHPYAPVLEKFVPELSRAGAEVIVVLFHDADGEDTEKPNPRHSCRRRGPKSSQGNARVRGTIPNPGRLGEVHRLRRGVRPKRRSTFAPNRCHGRGRCTAVPPFGRARIDRGSGAKSRRSRATSSVNSIDRFRRFRELAARQLHRGLLAEGASTAQFAILNHGASANLSRLPLCSAIHRRHAVPNNPTSSSSGSKRIAARDRFWSWAV